MLFGGPNMPKPPALPLPAAPPPIISDAAVTGARTRQAALAALAGGRGSILTSAQGLFGASTTKKSLLGQ